VILPIRVKNAGIVLWDTPSKKIILPRGARVEVIKGSWARQLGAVQRQDEYGVTDVLMDLDGSVRDFTMDALKKTDKPKAKEADKDPWKVGDVVYLYGHIAGLSDERTKWMSSCEIVGIDKDMPLSDPRRYSVEVEGKRGGKNIVKVGLKNLKRSS
jgi:hypothetical protein